MDDILRAFHHPAIRDENIEIQRNMFNTVRKWVEESPDWSNLNKYLSSQSVKAGDNHKLNVYDGSHNIFRGLGKDISNDGPLWTKVISRDLGEMRENDGNPAIGYLSTSSRTGSPALPSRTPDFGYSTSQYLSLIHI